MKTEAQKDEAITALRRRLNRARYDKYSPRTVERTQAVRNWEIANDALSAAANSQGATLRHHLSRAEQAIRRIEVA